jgi:arylsulfatase A-like enzyme
MHHHVESVALTVDASLGRNGAEDVNTKPEFELLESRSVMSKNIVLIVMDDMRSDLLEYMPRTERIIRGDGTEFVNAYVTTPSCCPSRASILTGEYASSHGVINNLSAALFNDFQALPVWLDDAGYETGFYGKYLNTYDGSFVPPGWDDWHAFEARWLRRNGGYFDFRLNNNGSHRFYEKGYSTDVLRKQAVRFIERQTSDAPFFVAFFPRAPHGPSQPAPRHQNLPVRLPPKPPSYNEADLSDKPASIRQAALWSAAAQAQADAVFRDEIRTLRAVDEAIKAMYDATVALGKHNETVFIFTSDNGKLWGEHRHIGKFIPYEEAIRVPLLISNTSIGRRSRDLALNIDIAPTILDFAELPIPASVQGESLRDGSHRDHFFIEQFEVGMHNYTGVHGKKYVYIRYKNGVKEFYNLTVDPFQLNNRAGIIDLSPYQALLNKHNKH